MVPTRRERIGLVLTGLAILLVLAAGLGLLDRLAWAIVEVFR